MKTSLICLFRKNLQAFLLLAAALAFLLLSPAALAAASFNANFSSGTINRNLAVSISPPSWGSFSISGGKAIMLQQTSGTNGSVDLATDFTLIGDFSITALVDGSLLGERCEAGLIVFDPTSSVYADVYFYTFVSGTFNRMYDIVAYCTLGNAQTTIPAGVPMPLTTFKITRVGNTITQYYGDASGSNFVPFNSYSDSRLAVPMKAEIFFLEEYLDNAGSFKVNNFSMQAQAFQGFSFPETALISLLLLGD